MCEFIDVSLQTADDHYKHYKQQMIRGNLQFYDLSIILADLTVS